MSYTWSVLKTDKNSLILGAFFWGFASIFFVGALVNFLNIDYSIWVGLFLLFIVFPITTFIFYKIGSNKRKTKK